MHNLGDSNTSFNDSLRSARTIMRLGNVPDHCGKFGQSHSDIMENLSVVPGAVHSEMVRTVDSGICQHTDSHTQADQHLFGVHQRSTGGEFVSHWYRLAADPYVTHHCPHCGMAFFDNGMKGWRPITDGQYSEPTWTCPQCGTDLRTIEDRPVGFGPLYGY